MNTDSNTKVENDVFAKFGATHTIEKRSGTSPTLTDLADNQSVCYGDGKTFHYLLTEKPKLDSNTPIDEKPVIDLKTTYEVQTGEKWKNSQGEPDIDYVAWLEKRINDERKSPSKSISEEELEAESQREISGLYMKLKDVEICKRGFKIARRLHVSRESELRQGIDMLVKHKNEEIKKLVSREKELIEELSHWKDLAETNLRVSDDLDESVKSLTEENERLKDEIQAMKDSLKRAKHLSELNWE